MAFVHYLTDRCRILNRAASTSGKNDTETWSEQPEDTPCRAMKSSSQKPTGADAADKVQYGTVIAMRFMLPKTATVAAHDRIRFDGRVYSVIEVLNAGGTSMHHKVAVCDARA